MKLNDFVQPADVFSVVNRSVLVKDVLSHLSFRIEKAESEGLKGTWKVHDIYRDAASDLLKFAGVAISETRELQRHSFNIVEWVLSLGHVLAVITAVALFTLYP